MGKVSPNAVLDAALTYVAASDRMVICTAEPATYAAATGIALANIAMTPGDGNDYGIADDPAAGTGRKVTMVAKSTQAILASGNATHIALLL